MSAFFANYPPIVVSGGGGGSATAANQVLEIAQLTAINSNTVGLATETTLAALNAKVTAVDTGNVTVVASALPTGAATSAAQATGNASLASIDGKLTAPLAVTGPLTDTQLRASAVPVSASALPLPTGAATSALQTAGNASLASIDSHIIKADTDNVTVVASALPSGASTAANQVTAQTSLSAIAVSDASIDTKTPALGQAVMAASTPVAIASDQSPIPVSASALPLPSGAATSANQATEIASLSTIATNTANPPVKLQDGAGNPITSSSNGFQRSLDVQLHDNSGNSFQGQQTMAGSLPVAIASNQSTLPVSAAALPLPSGAATSALQTTGNTSLASIDTKTPALGQALDAASVPVVLTAAQLTTLTPLSSVTVTQATGSNLHVAVDSLPSIPAGANAIGSVSVSNFPATQPVSGTVAVSALPSIPAGSNAIGSITNTSFGSKIAGLSVANAPVYNVYSSTNITTAAYVQLIAATTSAAQNVQIFDSSGQGMILAIGAPGSEVIQAYVAPGGDAFQLNIPAGSRVAYKALTADATAGYLLINLLG